MTQHDPRELRNAFGTFMTGVTVVTAKAEDGAPIGFTANSFTSVSLDPPLVLVCLANSSSNYQAFTSAKGFAVNILSEAQKDVSNTFARPVEDRFATVDWRDGPNGAPVIDGVSAWFDCSMFKTVEAGDHIILVGKVEGFEANPAPGLGYARGAYVTPAAEVAALNQNLDMIVSALIARDGKVLLIEAKGGLTLPEMRVGKGGTSAALAAVIAGTGLTAEPGFVYSVYEDSDRQCQQITFKCAAGGEVPGIGQFAVLSDENLQRVADPAMRSMLSRFREESRIGNFGIYYGDQQSGQVRTISAGS
ncbi:MAG: flavin reductase [Paracoccus sp. (in: a-proteobacteria)]